jgi:hypothetical protein
VLRTTLSHSRRVNEFLGSVTRSEHFSIEPAVMDSEIEQLPDLAGFLKFASQDSWRRVVLKPRGRIEPTAGLTPAFIAAKMRASAVTPATAPRRTVSPAASVPKRERASPSRRRSTRVAPRVDQQPEVGP